MNFGEVSADGVDVGPKVGVRNQVVERALAELLEEPFDEVMPPTVATNVGYLEASNAYREFRLSPGSALGRTAQEIVDTVKRVGIPFIERNRELAVLAETLASDKFNVTNEQAAYRRPIALRLLGRSGDALKEVEAYEAGIGERRDPAAGRFRRFAKALRSGSFPGSNT